MSIEKESLDNLDRYWYEWCSDTKGKTFGQYVVDKQNNLDKELINITNAEFAYRSIYYAVMDGLQIK